MRISGIGDASPAPTTPGPRPKAHGPAGHAGPSRSESAAGGLPFIVAPERSARPSGFSVPSQLAPGSLSPIDLRFPPLPHRHMGTQFQGTPLLYHDLILIGKDNRTIENYGGVPGDLRKWELLDYAVKDFLMTDSATPTC